MRQLLLIGVLFIISCKQNGETTKVDSAISIPSSFEHDFQNPSISIDNRVENLISLMTLEEKVAQLKYDAPAIDRLNVPEYNWWNECLHGVARNGRATVFPQAIGMAAAWDTEMMERIGVAVSDEARAKYNANIAVGNRGRYQGLTFWTPNVNIFRDPRWGRGQETYGEDPLLTSKIGVSYVKGLQGDHPKYLKSAAMAKHYAVHNGPEESRHVFDAEVNMKDLWETYLPAFEALVKEADVEGVMGAYNRTNGDPCCAHPYLMDEVLRKQWGFDGYFVSDCWAIVDFHNGHNVVKTPEEAAALALNNGCNLNCGSTYPQLIKAIEQGHTTEAEVDANLRELLPTRFKLGLFDPIGANPYDQISSEVIHSEENVQLSREAAAKSMVLLKNKDNILPLKKDLNAIFVTGPTATHAQALLANYYGVSENLVTFLEGITGAVSDHTAVKYSQGALLDEKNRNPMDWFSGTGQESDVTIACVGISQLIEGEEGESIASSHKGDRVDIKLPQNQIDFLKKIRETSEKLVVVITSGSAMACKEVYDMADAVIYAWYPGEQGGNALADVLLANRTYRYQKKEPLFPFGFGLSYGSFEYSNLTLDKIQIDKGENISATITIKNNADVDAEEIVQLYLTDEKASSPQPFYALKDFKRIHLRKGESKKISFDLTPKMMETVKNDGMKEIESGDFTVYIGGSIPSKRSIDLGASQYLKKQFSVKG